MGICSHKNVSIFLYWGEGSRKGSSSYIGLLSGSFLFHKVKKGFEEIKVVWKDPGAVSLYVVVARRDEDSVKAPHMAVSYRQPRIMSWNPGTEKAALSVRLLGSTVGDLVTEQHAGEAVRPARWRRARTSGFSAIIQTSWLHSGPISTPAAGGGPGPEVHSASSVPALLPLRLKPNFSASPFACFPSTVPHENHQCNHILLCSLSRFIFLRKRLFYHYFA